VFVAEKPPGTLWNSQGVCDKAFRRGTEGKTAGDQEWVPHGHTGGDKGPAHAGTLLLCLARCTSISSLVLAKLEDGAIEFGGRGSTKEDLASFAIFDGPVLRIVTNHCDA
jgi:hypothetical protein